MSVDFDARTGTLTADEAVLDVLLRQVSGAATGDADSASALAALRAAGVLDESGRAHPVLGPALDALRLPDRGTLSLSYAGKALQGWVSAATATLLMPTGEDGRRKLLRLHPSLLPEALARAAGLSSRPRPNHAVALDDLPGAVTLNRWWRLSAAWSAADGSWDGRMLEVIDASSGLFTVEPGPTGADRLAVPATPTRIWRLLVRLIARTRLDGLQPLPLDAGLPRVDGRPGATTDPVGESVTASDQWGADPARAAGAATVDLVSVVVGSRGATSGREGVGTATADSRVGAVSTAGDAMVRSAGHIGRLPTVEELAAGAARRLPGLQPDARRATRTGR